MKKGIRMIGGREYLLNGRYVGFDAKEKAVAEIKRKRNAGSQVRLICRMKDFDYMIYQHG